MKNKFLVFIFLFITIYSNGQNKNILTGILLDNYSNEITGKGTEVEGKRTGKWILYFGKTTHKYAEGNYENGLKQGEWTTFLSIGKLRSKGIYENGKLMSLTVFKDNQDTSLTIHSNQGININTTEKIDIIIRELYVFALKVTSKTVANENGTLIGVNSIGELLAKENQEAVIKFWEFDEVLRQQLSVKDRIIEKEVYKYQQGKINFISTYFNDVLLIEKRIDHQTNMIYEFYSYTNGKSKEDRIYLQTKNGLVQTGKWTKYYENGKKKAVVPYNRKGELHGTLKIWNADKKLIKQEKYKNGKLEEKKI